MKKIKLGLSGISIILFYFLLNTPNSLFSMQNAEIAIIKEGDSKSMDVTTIEKSNWLNEVTQWADRVERQKHNPKTTLKISNVSSKPLVDDTEKTVEFTLVESSGSDTQNEFLVEENQIAYSTSTGLELVFFETEIIQNLENDEKLHQEMLEEQINETSKNIDALRIQAIEASDPNDRLAALKNLNAQSSGQATLALIDVAKNTFDENRILVVNALIDRLRNRDSQREQLIITLSEFLDDGIPSVVNLARTSLESIVGEEN